MKFGILRSARLLMHRLIQSDARYCEKYFRTTASPKLHIGGGPRLIDGWLNTDLIRFPGVVAMDATRTFPFVTGTFDFIYSEHMVEHISYKQGRMMLAECLRVLKPGGTVRVVTPDLQKLLCLAGDNLSDLQQRYLEFFCSAFIPADMPRNATSALNAHFRDWGHTYVYDEDTLRGVMASAGFVDIKRYSLIDSPHPPLVGLANQCRYPPDLLEYESVVLEGIKP